MSLPHFTYGAECLNGNRTNQLAMEEFSTPGERLVEHNLWQ
jgi:hypothetical protein